jgi:hypothetical protein
MSRFYSNHGEEKTMIVGFTRYSHDQSFAVLFRNGRFAMAMVVG